MTKENGQYNLYFIDWKMPEMDGITLAREISAIAANKPDIFMISAYDWMSIEQEAREAGFTGFLSKPLFPSDIVECIHEHIHVQTDTVSDNTVQEQANSFQGHRILLVEDVEINREIVLALLEPTKLTIDCAINGVEALRIFSASPELYDMIFMDIQMPEMDGITATQKIRGLDIPKAKEIPIVAMTANVFKEDIEECLEAGMNGHISKPIDYNDILAKLAQYL